MKNIDNAVACLEIGSIAFGYRILNEMASVPKSRIIEASPCGGKFLILMTGAHDELNRAVHEARQKFDSNSWVDSAVFEAKDQRVIEAFYALPQDPIDESLVVVDCETVSGCLEAAFTLVDKGGLTPIEIRVQRSSTGGAYGFFTGSTEKCTAVAESARHVLTSSGRKGQVEVIDRPAQAFREFFELSNT